MAMTRSLSGRVLRRSSVRLLPSPAASSIPFASQFSAGAREAPFPSAYPATRSFLVRSYRRSSESNRQLSTKNKEDIKNNGADDPMLVKLIKRFLKKIGHPSQFTVAELNEWSRNHKGWKDTNQSVPVFRMFTGALFITIVSGNWKEIKTSFKEFAGRLTGVERKAQDKD